MGFDKITLKSIYCIALFMGLLFVSCRSRGPHNKVWESKHHPSEALRKEYKKANEKGTKDYKSSKKRFKRLHRK